MTWLTSLAGILAGAAHGVNEGIDMTKPGPRWHRWFSLYHRLWLLEAAFLIWFGYRGASTPLSFWLLPCLILANACYEISYGISRYKNPFPDYENFLGLGGDAKSKFYIDGWKVRVLQVGRLAVGLTLYFLW